MQKLFKYNWQVRDDWFTWCETVSEGELLKKRVGRIGSILYTLFYIVDIKYYYKYGEVMLHVIAHVIHHIGQLSVWSREIGRKPVAANLINRGLLEYGE